MDFDLETHLSRAVLGDSAVVLPSTASILSSSRPGTPGGGSSGARPIPGHRRPVSTHTFSSSFNSPPPFPNLLSSLTERAQPLSPTTTIAKTPASRYIRPARCLTDSILSSSSSIDSLLGKSAPRTPPPVTAPPTPAQLVAAPVKIPVSPSDHPVVVAAPAAAVTESALREPVAATSLNAPVEVIEAPINPKQVQDPIPGDSPPSQSAATSERVQKLKSKAIAEIFITTDLKKTQNKTQIQTHLTESPASLDIPQSLLPQEPISINTVPPTEPAPVEVLAPPVAEELNTSLSSEPPKQQEIPLSSLAELASEVQIPAADVPTQVSVPAQLVTPPSTPARKKPSPAEPSSATPTKTHLPEEGDSFRDFRESPKPLSTPPPSPSAPVSRPSFGKLSSFGTSFSSLVQAVTTAKAASNMGLTGDTRKVSSGHNGFGGWLQKRASIQTISATEGANGKSEEDGSSKSPTPKKPTIDKENTGNGINEGLSVSSTSIRSSASSFVEGSSRPTTPQKSPAPNLSLVSPARIATSPLKTIPEPPHPALVDEFQGLSFPMLINSFRTSPSKNVGEPPAEDRLEELANMAQDLLERMYSAYTKRTLALGEVLSDQSILREEVEERKVKARHLQSQLDRMSQEAQTEKEVKDEVISDLMKALENEKMMIEEERRGWEEERDNWRNTEREKIRAELMMEMLAAQGAGELEDGEGDAEMTPKKKRVSSGGASSDSGFDESDKSDTDSFYAMTKVEAAEEKGASRIVRKASSASVVTLSTIQSTPMTAGKTNNGGERRGKMMPPPLLNPTPLSVMKCESCARMSFTSRPSSPTPSITSFSSPPPSVPGSLNPSRFSTHKNLESPQQSSAPPSANSTTTSSRWGWGLRGNNHNNQQELDRLRGENKNLRERVGDLEKSVDDVLGVLGGWRS